MGRGGFRVSAHAENISTSTPLIAPIYYPGLYTVSSVYLHHERLIMLHRKRLELALEKVTASDWARFEEFASAFLTSEFPNLRTVASPSGDEGRDAELFFPEGEPSVVLQYSVTSKWEAKIRDTAKKVSKNLSVTKQLLYVTNQKIGAKADTLKKELRQKYGLSLDVRDQSFFLDRFEGDDHRETVAANLARDIVDPFLEGKEIIEQKAQAFTSGESRAALVFLELQWEDDSRDKGLTKTAFDALVRTALRSTDASHRLARKDIHSAVCALLPERDQAFVIAETDKSLSRLTKHYIRHHQPIDEFCLTHEESERLKGRLAEIEIVDQQLRAEIVGVLRSVIPENDVFNNEQLMSLLTVCRTSMEKFLHQRGELFVAALDGGQLNRLGFDAVQKTVEDELKLRAAVIEQNETTVGCVALAVERVLTSPSTAIAAYLRDIADAYTFMAFLQETPDVQSAVRKMFSGGEIWIDTSIVLPLLAEELLPSEQWQFRRLISVAQEAGLKFKVTRGVIEEVERHMNRSKTCAGYTNGLWRGSYPYLFSFYVAKGAAPSSFTSWLAQFRGDARPEDDISEYLNNFFHIQSQDISVDAMKADQNVRFAVKEAWIKIHNDRRNRAGNEIDPILALRLAEHDTENYMGVIARRQQEGSAAFGYTSWWLTLDHMAFEINRQISTHLGGMPPPSPVMSADFLTNYLAFGPLRGKVARSLSGVLPVAMDPGLIEYLTPELVSLASTVRGASLGMPEHVIRRKVRDALDAAKRRTGNVTNRGLNAQIAEIDRV